MADPHLISVDELRAAGALDVPESWRKSLAPVKESRQRTLLFDDEESVPDEQQLVPEDSEDD